MIPDWLAKIAPAYYAPAPLLSASGEEADVRIEVVNRGLAIEQSALNQIFDPLKRGSVQHHDTYDSLGPGLYIVREVAGHMGARSTCVPTREKQCSLWACRAAMRLIALVGPGVFPG